MTGLGSGAGGSGTGVGWGVETSGLVLATRGVRRMPHRRSGAVRPVTGGAMWRRAYRTLCQLLLRIQKAGP